jgi:hypothetical protein
MTAPDRAGEDVRAKLDKLKKRLAKTNRKTQEQDFYRSTLEHMEFVRRLDTAMLNEPVKQLRKIISSTEQ